MKKFLMILIYLIATSTVFAADSKEAPVSDHQIPAVHKIHGKGIVSIGVAAANKPFSYVDPKGNYQGYDVYFARQLAKELLGSKRAVYFVPVTETDWIEFLENDRVDIVIAGFAATKENRERADFALPYRRITPGADLYTAAAVKKGNEGLLHWLNNVITNRLADNFFLKDYNTTLRSVYGTTSDPKLLIVERGAAAW